MLRVSGLELSTTKPASGFNFLLKHPFNFKFSHTDNSFKSSNEDFYFYIRDSPLNLVTHIYLETSAPEYFDQIKITQANESHHNSTSTEKSITFSSIFSHLRHTVVLKSPSEIVSSISIDHLAFVCSGDDKSHELSTQWYEKAFGLHHRERPINMKYSNFGLDINLIHNGGPFQIVVSRSTSHGPDQISRFLAKNSGHGGLQHVAISCGSDDTFSLGTDNSGLVMASPPPGYYDTIRGYFLTPEGVELFNKAKASGLLIDFDEQIGGYLMQQFSKPILGDDTFFLEFIHRVDNERGLGKRNVEALWKSLERSTMVAKRSGNE